MILILIKWYSEMLVMASLLSVPSHRYGLYKRFEFKV